MTEPPERDSAERHPTVQVVDVSKYQELVTECITAESPASEGTRESPREDRMSPNQSAVAQAATKQNQKPKLVAHTRTLQSQNPKFGLTKWVLILAFLEVLALTGSWMVSTRLSMNKSPEKALQILGRKYGPDIRKLAAVDELLAAAGSTSDPTSVKIQSVCAKFARTLKDDEDDGGSDHNFLTQYFRARGNTLEYVEPGSQRPLPTATP